MTEIRPFNSCVKATEKAWKRNRKTLSTPRKRWSVSYTKTVNKEMKQKWGKIWVMKEDVAVSIHGQNKNKGIL